MSSLCIAFAETFEKFWFESQIVFYFNSPVFLAAALSYKGKWNISTVSWPEIHTFVNYNYKCFSTLLHLNNICLTLENLVENTIITPFTIWLPLCLILHPSLKIAKLTSIFFLTLFVRFDVMQWSWLMSWAERSVHVFKANLHSES